MLIPAEAITFEDQSDLIKYVMKGIAPSSKDFLKLRDAVANNCYSESAIPGKDVIVNPRIIEIDNNQMAEILTEIYDCKLENEVKTLVICSALCVGAFILGKCLD